MAKLNLRKVKKLTHPNLLPLSTIFHTYPLAVAWNISPTEKRTINRTPHAVLYWSTAVLQNCSTIGVYNGIYNCKPVFVFVANCVILRYLHKLHEQNYLRKYKKNLFLFIYILFLSMGVCLFVSNKRQNGWTDRIQILCGKSYAKSRKKTQAN